MTKMRDFRSKIADIAKRRGIYWGAYEIYGGIAGLYDYGPAGAALKKNLIDYWIEEFVTKDGLMLIDTPALGPENVYRASGHMEKFTDYMVSCRACGHAFRLDELISEYVEVPEELSAKKLNKLVRKYAIRCPDCGGELGDVEEFHLMFSTHIGLNKSGFLRPETAQGIFVNYSALYRINREKLPFGVAQIGRAYRNEISPRQGVLRQREFNMAEIELFFDPESKVVEEMIDETPIPLLLRDGKELRISARDAYHTGIMNGYIAYYMVKILKFFQKLGIDITRLRFRQHQRGELAHYSSDTWDAEVLISRGWTEITGISYRSSYDLERHMLYSGCDMYAFRRFEVEQKVTVTRLMPKMEILGPMFKGYAAKIANEMEKMEIDEYKGGPLKIEVDGKTYDIPEDAFELQYEEKIITGERFVPHVVEPSFGIDRIIYAMLENVYYERQDSGYKVLKLSPRIAPLKAGVFPLMNKDGMGIKAREILKYLRENALNAYYDDSGSIGRRYARADEIGVPFCITVDYQTIKDSTVTIRARDSTEQRRVKVTNIVQILKALENGTMQFTRIDENVQ